MKGDLPFLAKNVFEIIVLIVIIVLLVYTVNAIGNFVIMEDKKYIELVKFIENKIKSLGIDESAVWSDSVTYNPVRYSIYFNYTDRRIYLFRCESPEMLLIFSNISNNIWIKDLEGTNCHPLYVSTEVLNDAVIINFTAGPIVELSNGNVRRVTVVMLYDLKYNIMLYQGGGIYDYLAINDISEYKVITKDSRVLDISSYLAGVKSSLSKGLRVSDRCKLDSASKISCTINAKELFDNGRLTTFKMTVEIKKTSSNTIIIFKPTI